MPDTRHQIFNSQRTGSPSHWKVYDGIHRVSFLISAQGTILKTYLKVKPDVHASEVLADLDQLTDNPE